MLLLERECALSHSALLLRCHDQDDAASSRESLRHLLEQFSGFAFLTTRQRTVPLTRTLVLATLPVLRTVIS